MVVFTCFMCYCNLNNYLLLSFKLFLQLNAFLNLTETLSLLCARVWYRTELENSAAPFLTTFTSFRVSCV